MDNPCDLNISKGAIIGLKNTDDCSIIQDVPENSVTIVKSVPDQIIIANFTIFTKLETINVRAFWRHQKLQKVFFPPSLRTIGESAFQGCANLNCPLDLRNIRLSGWVFGFCMSLIGPVYLSGEATKARDLFSMCEKLVEIHVSNCTLIETKTFHNCRSLIEKYLDFSEVTTIKVSAFWACDSLIGPLYLPKIKVIESEAFIDCKKLVGIITNNCEMPIVRNEFARCPSLINLYNLTIVSYVFDGGFAGCLNLVGPIYLKNVTSIGNEAFIGCSKLTEIIDLSNVKTIGDKAFYGCKALNNLNISNVETIGQNAFYDCIKLTEIVGFNNISSIGNSAFMNCNLLKLIQIPSQKIEIINMKTFFNCKNLSDIVFPPNIISIQESAFSYCESLVSLIFPNRLKDISGSAFQHCVNLTTFNIVESLQHVGKLAFFNTSITCGFIPIRKIPKFRHAVPDHILANCDYDTIIHKRGFFLKILYTFTLQCLYIRRIYG